MAITTHGGTTDAADKPAGVVPIVSSAVLGVLRERFGERARLCEYYKQECITKGWKHEAHEGGSQKRNMALRSGNGLPRRMHT